MLNILSLNLFVFIKITSPHIMMLNYSFEPFLIKWQEAVVFFRTSEMIRPEIYPPIIRPVHDVIWILIKDTTLPSMVGYVFKAIKGPYPSVSCANFM